MKIWPAPGRRVRDPATGRPLGRRGAEVPDTAFWRRRLDDGDVLDHEPPTPAKPARQPRPPKAPKPTPPSPAAPTAKDPA